MNCKLISFLTLIFLGGTLFGCISCNDNFLERIPEDEISNVTFWQTENDLRIYNNGLYDIVLDPSVPIMLGHEGEDFTGMVWSADEFSDNLAPIINQFYQRIRSGRFTVPSEPQSYGFTGWNLIRACNVGIANYHRADLSEDVINKYEAEARLFRAWFYADKVELFGDVPFFEKELNIDSKELFDKRTPRDSVMTKVLEDLNFSCNNLPENWGNSDSPGRLNKWAALLLKSRFCLFEGTWRKYRDLPNSEMWLSEAAGAAKELIQNGPYSLFNTGDPMHDYNATQRATDLSSNTEVIYWKRYKIGIITNSVMDWYCARAGYGGATKSLVEEYLCIDGLPITLSPLYLGDRKYEDIFKNRDPRLRQTILDPEDQVYYNYERDISISYPRVTGMNGGTITTTGYHVIKMYNSEAAGKTFGTDVTPAIVMRLGECLLNYAEAKAELGELNQHDLDISINRLRDRVSMPHMMLDDLPDDPKYQGNGLSPLINEIRRERRIELCFEGRFRYDDLRRWKQGKLLEEKTLGMRWDQSNRDKIDPDGDATVKTIKVNGIDYIDVYQGTDFENPTFDENKNYLWPLPLNVLAQNPELGQNPGWKE